MCGFLLHAVSSVGDDPSPCIGGFDATATMKNYNFDRFGSSHFDFQGERLISSCIADNSVVLHKAETDSSRPVCWCCFAVDEICLPPETGTASSYS